MLLKLGGSIVTFKNKPVSVNKKAIERISKQLRKVKKPLIVVHGGGSFGHYYSVRYDMHTRPARYNLHGISVVRSSMVELNNHIVKIMVKQIYTWGAFTVGSMAVMTIILNGVRISMSGVSGDITEAKNKILQAIAGIVLLFMSGIILYTINPDFFT